VRLAEEQESTCQAKRSKDNDNDFSNPFSEKAQRKLEKTNAARRDSPEHTHLAEGETQFSGDEREKQIDGV